MGTHKHHIIPVHMGGTDHPDNLVEVTVEKHAELHKQLWEDLGHWQDYCAWQALSGQISSDELRRFITRMVWTGRKHSEEAKEKIRKKRKTQTVSDETRLKMSLKRKGKKLSWDLKNHTPEANRKRSLSMVGIEKPRITCPHCNKVGGLPQMKQWHFDNCKGKI